MTLYENLILTINTNTDALTVIIFSLFFCLFQNFPSNRMMARVCLNFESFLFCPPETISCFWNIDFCVKATTVRIEQQRLCSRFILIFDSL
jgi:hypothetical protein